MNQQNEATSSTPPAGLPAKRKRGRPRKDDNSAQGKTSTVLPGPEVAPPSDKNDDLMVGQVVSGVVEGTFDAGYFLSVRVGETDTLLRGVVFQPGRFVPISEANDVAPNARMYTRRNIPIPVGNPPIPVGNPPIPVGNPQSRQNNDRPVHLENPVPIVPLLAPSRFSPGTSFALQKPPASISGCSSSNFLNNNLGVALEKTNSEPSTPQVLPAKLPTDPSVTMKEGPKKDTETSKDLNLDSAASPLLEGLKAGVGTSNCLNLDPSPKPVIEECKTTPNVEASPLMDGPEVEMESSKDIVLDLTPKPVAEEPKVVEGPPKAEKEVNKDINLGLTSQPVIEEHNVMDFETSRLVKGPNTETEMTKDLNLHLTPNPVVESCKVMQDLESSHSVEEPALIKTSEGLNFNLPLGHGLEPSELPFEAEPKIPNLELQLTSIVADPKSASPSGHVFPTEDTVQLELPDSKKIGTSENGKPSTVAVDNNESDTNLNFQLKEEAALFKPEISAEGSVLPIPDILDSRSSGSSDPTRSMDCILKDAIALTESHGHPVVSDTPARNGDCIQN